MVNKIKATVEIECLKEHTCVGCGSTFRYPLKQSYSTERTTEADAQAAAQRGVARMLADAVESKPCPTCGRYQPDMVQPFGHGCLTFVLFLPLAALTTVGICAALGFVLPIYPVIAWAAALACGVATVLHIRMALLNPNRDLNANLKKAEELVKADTLRLEKQGQPQEPLGSTVPLNLSFAYWIAFLFLFLGTTLVASAEVVRLALGWPWNLSADPVAVGPGDDVYIYLPDQIESVKGHWNGRAVIEVLNSDEVGLPKQLPAYSKSDNWGKFILGKGSSSQKSRLWIAVHVPEKADLEGQTIKMQIALDVNYPASKGLFGFQNEQQNYDRTTELRVASPFAGLMYRSLWWGGGALGGILVMFTGFWLSRLAQKRRDKALPAKLILPSHEVPSVLPAD
jgi:hypothetical protein